ncbi:ABC transporter ATP-binding protein [Sorangium cellulosum]|uniref:Carbohydrate ABC transporter n=1 Tax=Sorangium cellulosum TaxID=56 RepID=A0A150R0K5_SORCE|nr:ABC transporter ATP-binding protein [Sorangium cellulosum]KYF73767.1 carbohydrate ABC transporter [Sorangium cellulosum]
MSAQAQRKTYRPSPPRREGRISRLSLRSTAQRLAAPSRSAGAERLRFFLRVGAYFKGEWARIGALSLLVCVSIAISLLQVWPVAVIVDLISSGPREGDLVHRLLLAPLPDSLLGRVLGLAAMTLVLRVAQEFVGMGRALLNFRIGYGGLMRVRCDVYRKLQALHIGYHRAQPQGDALYRLNQDATGFHGILNVAVSVLGSALTLAVMLCIMAARSPGLTLLALAVVPPLLLTNVKFGRALRRKCTEAKEVESQLTTSVQRSMASIGLVQACGREADEEARFHATLGNSVKAWLRLHHDELRHTLTVGSILGLGGALVLGYGGHLVVEARAGAGDAGMTLGALTAFLGYLGMLYDPLCKLTGAGAAVQGGVAGAQRVFEVLDRDQAVTDVHDAAALPPEPRTLSLENVGFEYRPGHPVLRGVDATIRPGEMVAFVGSAGAGKTTLFSLLPRFHNPTHGALRLDGIDTRAVRVADLRRHMAIVLQDCILLPATIAENIAYGRPSATGAEIRKAAEMAGAAGFVEALPDGYGTQIADGGLNLSAGQRQRIAIARALLSGAPILVIDEPTDGIDAEHERTLVEALRALKGQRTIILMSHRLSTVVGCDKIFVMERGRIVEHGAHADLLRRGGVYTAMARWQHLHTGHAGARPEARPGPRRAHPEPFRGDDALMG